MEGSDLLSQNSDNRFPPGNGRDILSTMPPEVMDMIISYLQCTASLAALGRTSKSYFPQAMPHVYRRVTYRYQDLNIPRAPGHRVPYRLQMEQMKSLLSPAQHNKLIKPFKEKSVPMSSTAIYWSHRCNSGLDEHAVPRHASYVRHLVDKGIANQRYRGCPPHLYVEEAMKNLDLQSFRTGYLTRSMAESLCCMNNLTTLNLTPVGLRSEDIDVVSRIKNLKHLKFRSRGLDQYKIEKMTEELDDIERRNPPTSATASEIAAQTAAIDQQSSEAQTNWFEAMRSILRNSAHCLETLDMYIPLTPENHMFLLEQDEVDEKGQGTLMLPAVTSFSIYSTTEDPLDSGFREALPRAVNWLNLTRLTLDGVDDPLVFRDLASLFGSESQNKTKPRLRHLELQLFRSYGLWNRMGRVPEVYEAKLSFVASFSTLETLRLCVFGMDSCGTDPGALVTAATKHVGLRVLEFSYAGCPRGPADQINTIQLSNLQRLVQGLDRLRELTIWPDMSNMRGLGHVLSSCRSLVSVKIGHWGRPWHPHGPQGLDYHEKLLDTTLGLLDGAAIHRRVEGDNENGGEFLWEKTFSLRSLRMLSDSLEFPSDTNEFLTEIETEINLPLPPLPPALPPTFTCGSRPRASELPGVSRGCVRSSYSGLSVPWRYLNKCPRVEHYNFLDADPVFDL